MGENIPDDIRKAAEEAWGDAGIMSTLNQQYEVIARALLAERKAERERCAKMADDHDDGDPHSDYGNAARDIATAIRSGVEDGRG